MINIPISIDLCNFIKETYQKKKKVFGTEISELIPRYEQFEGPIQWYAFEFIINDKMLTLLVFSTDKSKNSNYINFRSNYYEELTVKELKENLYPFFIQHQELSEIKNEIIKFSVYLAHQWDLSNNEYKRSGIFADNWSYIYLIGDIDEKIIINYIDKIFQTAKEALEKNKVNEDLCEKDANSIQEMKEIKREDSLFQDFFKDLKIEIQNILKFLPFRLDSKKTHIFENQILKKYGYDYDKSILCDKLQKMLPIDKRDCYINLDSTKILFRMKGLYSLFIENVLKLYAKNESDIEKITLNLLNEFIRSCKTQRLTYSILFPLTAIEFSVPKNLDQLYLELEKNTGIEFQNNLVVFSSESDMILKRTIEFKNTIDYSVMIRASGEIGYQFGPQRNIIKNMESKSTDDVDSIQYNALWMKIRNVYLSLILNNFIVGYGQPFYQFPWWVAQCKTEISFPLPYWLKYRYYFDPNNLTEIFYYNNFVSKNLIPYSYGAIKNRAFNLVVEKMRLRNRGEFDSGDLVKGITDVIVLPKKIDDLFGEYQVIKIPSNEYSKFLKTLELYSNPAIPINYNSECFILDTIIQFVQRDAIQDLILDSCLILESILVDKGEEVSYKFRFNASIILSESEDDFAKNLKFFKSLYDIRSIIIHGDSWAKKYIEFVEWIQKSKKKASITNFQYFESTKMNVKRVILELIIKILNRINEMEIPINLISKPEIIIKFFRFKPKNE